MKVNGPRGYQIWIILNKKKDLKCQLRVIKDIVHNIPIISLHEKVHYYYYYGPREMQPYFVGVWWTLKYVTFVNVVEMTAQEK